MNAIEQLVLADLETHLLLSQSRFQTFDSYVSETEKFVEAKYGGKVKVNAYFTKGDNGPQPMDVGSFIAAVASG